MTTPPDALPDDEIARLAHWSAPDEPLARLAREVQRLRAESHQAVHSWRNRASVLASTLETIRCHAASGRIDLSGEPDVAAMLESCHGVIERMRTQ